MKLKPSDVKTILFIQTAFLGDVLLTIPALNELRRLYPQAQVTLICRKGLGSLMEKLGVVEQFYEIDKGNSESYREVLRSLQQHTFDLLMTPHESLRTSFFASRIRARFKVGPRNFLNLLFFDQKIKKTKWLPEPLRVLEFSGWNKSSDLESDQLFHLENDRLSFDTGFASMSRRIQIQKWNEFQTMSLKFPQNKKRVLLFPGSVWETKRYSIESFFQVTRDLLRMGYEVVLMGAKNEAGLGEQIINNLNSNPVNSGRIENLIGQTNLVESLCLMVLSGVVLGNDSGSAHLAAVASCPSVTIFGPTVLEFGYRPWSNQSWIVQTKKKLDCRPCGSHGHRKCPVGTHECIKSITPQDVVDVFLKIN